MCVLLACRGMLTDMHHGTLHIGAVWFRFVALRVCTAIGFEQAEFIRGSSVRALYFSAVLGYGADGSMLLGFAHRAVHFARVRPRVICREIC